MEETKEIKSKTNNKKVPIIICIIIILVLLIVFIATSSLRLEKNMKKLGSNFYSNYYYEKVLGDKDTKEVSATLKNYKDIGIKVSLAAVDRYASKGNEKVIKKLKNAGCDEEKTEAIIYPKKPYGKDDYKIEVTLSCKK